MILIVDDSESVCMTMRSMLRKITEDVHVAMTYKDATKLLEENEYVIVVCDLNLGDLKFDGFTLYQSFKPDDNYDHEGDPPTHWIFMSGSLEKAGDIWGLPHSSFVMKGDSFSGVLNHIQQILYLREMTIKNREKLDNLNFGFHIDEEALLDKFMGHFLTQKQYSKSVQSLKDEIHEGFSTLNETLTSSLNSNTEKLKENTKKITAVQEEIKPSWTRMGHWFRFMNAEYLLPIFLLIGVGFYFLHFKGL